MDASAPAGGDGSGAHPFRTLAEAPARGRIRLAAGVYRGGLLLEDVELVGGKAVVLASSAEGPCVRARGTVRLERVQIQGGAAGLLVESGRTTLESVGLSGQRGSAIEVQGAAELVAARSTLQASVSGFPGLRILPGGRAELREVRIRGPFQRAVHATAPAALLLSGVQIEDAVTGVWLSGGAASLEQVEVRGGRGPGLYVAGAALQLREVRVTGHEYGLLSGGDARVDARGLRSTGAQNAGLALVRSQAVLEEVRIDSPGQLAGVQLVSSEVRIRGLQISGGRSSGLITRDGRLTLEEATFVGPHSILSIDGDAIQIRGGHATLSGIRVRDCSGIGILAAEGAAVTLSRSSIGGAGVAGVSVENDARLTATEISIEGTRGPAVLVAERGTAELRALTARSNRDGPVWAECSKGAQVNIEGWTGDVPPSPVPCMRNGAAVNPPH
ncbi:MAG: right-handed parallel beta-helix repeat-containing protein [Myxococcaceae bacterium]